MYQQQEVEKKERRKIIAATTAIAVIILILIVAIIVVATKKSGRTDIGKGENSAFEIKDEKSDTKTEETIENKEATDNSTDNKDNTDNDMVETISLEKSSDTIASAEPAANSAEAQSNVPVQSNQDVAIANNNLPDTGPEEFLPVALVAGVLVMYLSSLVLAKREV